MAVMERQAKAGSQAAPKRARIAVIGAGIVGNCLVAHLAELGWDELVLIDKGPLPNPGGSTGHASNFIFPTDHNREIAMLTLESQRQYEELGVNTTCGGVEVARTEERMEELRRRMTSARSWGIEAYLLTPQEVAERIPFVNADVIAGGFYMPAVSVVDSVRAGTIMRERALAKGALTVLDNTEVTGLEVERRAFHRPRLRAVVTGRGAIAVEHAVIACGVWSPRLAAMAGANIPLTPAVHQMADVGPIDLLQATGNEIGYPIVRDMTNIPNTVTSPTAPTIPTTVQSNANPSNGTSCLCRSALQRCPGGEHAGRIAVGVVIHDVLQRRPVALPQRSVIHAHDGVDDVDAEPYLEHAHRERLRLRGGSVPHDVKRVPVRIERYDLLQPHSETLYRSSKVNMLRSNAQDPRVLVLHRARLHRLPSERAGPNVHALGHSNARPHRTAPELAACNLLEVSNVREHPHQGLALHHVERQSTELRPHSPEIEPRENLFLGQRLEQIHHLEHLKMLPIHVQPSLVEVEARAVSIQTALLLVGQHMVFHRLLHGLAPPILQNLRQLILVHLDTRRRSLLLDPPFQILQAHSPQRRIHTRGADRLHRAIVPLRALLVLLAQESSRLPAVSAVPQASVSSIR